MKAIKYLNIIKKNISYKIQRECLFEINKHFHNINKKFFHSLSNFQITGKEENVELY